MGSWPTVRLTAVPHDEGAVALARQVRTSLCGAGAWDRGPLDVAEGCAAGRFRLGQRRLGAGRGGLEALLIPREGQFELVVDTEPRGGWASVTPSMRAQLHRHRLRFRTAHEWGHSFFYARDASSIVRRVGDSEEQEQFCDAFARALLVPPSVALSLAPRAASVIALQKRFDVSLELAARALAHAHPQAAFWLVVASPGNPKAPLVQWRSSASYRCGVRTKHVLDSVAAQGFDASVAVPVRRACRGVELAVLGERRQALVFVAPPSVALHGEPLRG